MGLVFAEVDMGVAVEAVVVVVVVGEAVVVETEALFSDGADVAGASIDDGVNTGLFVVAEEELFGAGPCDSAVLVTACSPIIVLHNKMI